MAIPTNNSANLTDITTRARLSAEKIGVLKYKLKKAQKAKTEALQLQDAFNGCTTYEQWYSKVDQAVKAITKARKRAPKLRRKAELLGALRKAPCGLKSRRRPARARALRKALKLEAAAEAARELLGVEKSAPMSVLKKAAEAKAAEYKAAEKAAMCAHWARTMRVNELERQLEKAQQQRAAVDTGSMYPIF